MHELIALVTPEGVTSLEALFNEANRQVFGEYYDARTCSDELKELAKYKSLKDGS